MNTKPRNQPFPAPPFPVVETWTPSPTSPPSKTVLISPQSLPLPGLISPVSCLRTWCSTWLQAAYWQVVSNTLNHDISWIIKCIFFTNSTFGEFPFTYACLGFGMIDSTFWWMYKHLKGEFFFMTKPISSTYFNSEHEVKPEVLDCIFFFYYFFFHTLKTVGECHYSVEIFLMLCFVLT